MSESQIYYKAAAKTCIVCQLLIPPTTVNTFKKKEKHSGLNKRKSSKRKIPTQIISPDRRLVFGTQRRDRRVKKNSEEPFDFELIRVDRFFQSYRIPRRANLLEDISPDE